MALKYLYEQDYLSTGWPDDGGGGLTPFSWWDRDLANDVVKPLYALEPGFATESDVFYAEPPITTEITAAFVVEEDVFFQPMSVRALRQPAEMLRNEVRRVR